TCEPLASPWVASPGLLALGCWPWVAGPGLLALCSWHLLACEAACHASAFTVTPRRRGRQGRVGGSRTPPQTWREVYLYICSAGAGSLDRMGWAVLRQFVVRARSRRYPESGSWRIAPNVCAT